MRMRCLNGFLSINVVSVGLGLAPGSGLARGAYEYELECTVGACTYAVRNDLISLLIPRYTIRWTWKHGITGTCNAYKSSNKCKISNIQHDLHALSIPSFPSLLLFVRNHVRSTRADTQIFFARARSLCAHMTWTLPKFLSFFVLYILGLSDFLFTFSFPIHHITSHHT